MATRPAPVPDREHAPRRDGAQAPPLPPATTLPRPADRRLVGSRAPPVLPRSRPAATPPSRPERRADRSEEHTSELQSRGHLVCRLLLEKKKKILYSQLLGM